MGDMNQETVIDDEAKETCELAQIHIDNCIKNHICECGGELDVSTSGYPEFYCKQCGMTRDISFFPTKQEFSDDVIEDLVGELNIIGVKDLVRNCPKCDFVCSAKDSYVVCPMCDVKLEESSVDIFINKRTFGEVKEAKTAEEKAAVFLNWVELQKDLINSLKKYEDLCYGEFYGEMDYETELQLYTFDRIKDYFISIFKLKFEKTEKGKKVVMSD